MARKPGWGAMHVESKKLSTMAAEIAAGKRAPVTLYRIEATGWRGDMSNTRYLAYQYFLNLHDDMYDFVILSDGRDVFFQRDPFTFHWCDLGSDCAATLHAFIEHTDVDGQNGTSRTIASCLWNSRWILRCYGSHGLHEIGGNSIICSGVVVGSFRAISTWLQEMIHGMFNNQHCAAMHGADQGVHNFIVHTHDSNSSFSLKLWTNDAGPVSTIGGGRLFRDGEGRVLNSRGDVAYIVHQYDRRPEIVSHVAFTFLANSSHR
jgi:hypothetical protein